MTSMQEKYQQIIKNIDRQQTEDEVLYRSLSNLNQAQVAPISLTPIVKQMNFFRKIQLNEAVYNESAYFIRTSQQGDAFKANCEKVSRRCLSPQERLKQALYETPLNEQIKEQSIKKYTRRKSCLGGIFGEPSSQMVVREKQFPFGFIVQHIMTIIDENEKRNKQRQINALKNQKKFNVNNKVPKNPSFKLYSGKSIFNSQQNNITGSNMAQSLGNNYSYQSQNFQSLLQQNGIQPKFNSTLADNKNVIQNLVGASIQSPRSNNVVRLSNSSQHSNQSQTTQQQTQAPIASQGNESQLENSKTLQNYFLEDGNESNQLSKMEIDTQNQQKIDQEDKKGYPQSIHEEDDNLFLSLEKTKKISMLLSGGSQKQNGQDSLSSHSSLDLDENDEDQQHENKKRDSKSVQMNYKKSVKERFSFLKDQNLEEKKINLIHENNIKRDSQLYINFGRNSQRFSVINAIAPTLHQQVLQKQQMLLNRLPTFIQNEKQNEAQMKKDAIMTNNIKKINESKQLQDVLQEYLEPGSTENQNYCPSNPINRTKNLKRALVTATNLIALQNKVKGNKAFLINYYKLIGKLTIDTNVQYLSQFADEILATPTQKLQQKTMIVCAPKRRKVFLYNTPEDKVKLISQLDKLHLNQKVQQYINDKSTNDNNQSFSKSVMTNRDRSQTGFKSYFQNQNDLDFANKASEYTPEIKPLSQTVKSKFLFKDSFNQALQKSTNKYNITINNLTQRSQSQKNKNPVDLSLKKVLNSNDQDFSQYSSSGKNFFSLSQKNSLAFLDKIGKNSNNNSTYFTKAPLQPYFSSQAPQCISTPKLASPRIHQKKIKIVNKSNINNNQFDQGTIQNSLIKPQIKNFQTQQNS